MNTDEDANFTCADGTANCNETYTNNPQKGTTLDDIASILNFYYTPLLIIFGCLGNLISIFVFHMSKLRLQSTSVYLSALAISDTVFLLQLLPPWLHSTGISNIFYKPGICQTVVYASYVSCFASTWIVVAFTVERFVAVLHPLKRTLFCTVNRAKYIVSSLILIAVILNVPVMKFTVPNLYDCNVDDKYLEEAARFNLVDTAISFTIPLGAIIVLNMRIMRRVCKLEKTQRRLLKIERHHTRHPSRMVKPQPSLYQNRVTRMLLLVSSVYVILNVPAYTMRILAYAYDMDREKLGERWSAYQHLALASFNTNFGINFMLYCLSGQNFRRALCNTIPWLRRRTIRSAVVIHRNGRIPGQVTSNSTSLASGGAGGANTILGEEAPPVRRHRSEPVIKRWTFDNSRQRNRVDGPPIEMETCDVGNGWIVTESNISHQIRRNGQIPDTQVRRIPFLFFPYRRLMINRHRNAIQANAASYN